MTLFLAPPRPHILFLFLFFISIFLNLRTTILGTLFGTWFLHIKKNYFFFPLICSQSFFHNFQFDLLRKCHWTHFAENENAKSSFHIMFSFSHFLSIENENETTKNQKKKKKYKKQKKGKKEEEGNENRTHHFFQQNQIYALLKWPP